MNVTQKERELLTAILEDCYHGEGGRDRVGEWVWTWSPCESFGTSAGGIMSSLVKKGLAEVDDRIGGEDGVCSITQAGYDILEPNFEEIVEKADRAFWAVIAESNPTVTSGHFGPAETIAWNEAMKTAVRQWLHLNAPNDDTPDPDDAPCATGGP